jgi:hypothetical protein
MDRVYVYYIAVLLITSVMLPFFTVAQQPEPNLDVRIVNGFEYEVLPGLAKVISIRVVKAAAKSTLNYDEYEILFQFIPMQGEELLEILKDKALEFKLSYHFSQVAVGPAYIQKMNLTEGTSYAMDLCQLKSKGVNTERFFYESKALENNLFEAYNDIVDGLYLKLSFDAINSLHIQVDIKKLSKVEQRVLVDAELKYGMEHNNFVVPKFTQEALDYINQHKALLKEYEAALVALSRMEEDKHREKDLEEQLRRDEEVKLEEKIAVIQGDKISKVVNQTKIIRGCFYEALPGLAKVTSIKITKNASESAWDYDEHQVLFKFTPMEGHDLLEKLKDINLEFFLNYRGDKIPVGAAYIQQKNVRVGTRYAMTLYQKRDKNACSDQYTYESKGLDNDLFEAYPPKTYFASQKARMDSMDQESSIKAVQPKLEEESTPKIDTISVKVEMTYEEALENVEKAKAERKKWRKICSQAIKDAREKARATKKIQQRKYNEKSKDE